SRQEYAQAARLLTAPVRIAHLLARGHEPADVGDASALRRAALKELAALQRGLLAPERNQGAGEVEDLRLAGGDPPVEPGQLVVLAVGVVVAPLGVAQLVAAADHR